MAVRDDAERSPATASQKDKKPSFRDDPVAARNTPVYL
jgi:hypothetical protein